MQAAVQERYGALEEVVRVREVTDPAVKDGEVLVRVHAASIHVGDVFVARGEPYVMRPIFGLRRPKDRIPGTDVAGVVEAVGGGVTGLSPGDEVLGWCKGAFAEYVVAPAAQLVRKPAELSFEEAAAIGVSATTALQALRDHGKVQPGHKVLIVGAAGGVGSFAVQIAKAMGAEVTGVCSTAKVEVVRAIGADHVIDYTSQDFTAGPERYDLIFDNVGTESASAVRRVLTPTGTLLSNGSDVHGWLGGLGTPVRAALTSMVVRQQGRPFLSLPDRDDLLYLVELARSGQVRPLIDRTLPLAQAAEALAHVGRRHATGTTVLTA